MAGKNYMEQPKALIIMATGTGRTRTTMALIDVSLCETIRLMGEVPKGDAMDAVIESAGGWPMK
jgi:hypothetical protein